MNKKEEWEQHWELSSLLNWSSISDEEVNRVKAVISQHYKVPMPFKVRVTDRCICRCTGPHGKSVTFSIIGMDGQVLMSGLRIDANGFS